MTRQLLKPRLNMVCFKKASSTKITLKNLWGRSKISCYNHSLQRLYLWEPIRPNLPIYLSGLTQMFHSRCNTCHYMPPQGTNRHSLSAIIKCRWCQMLKIYPTCDNTNLPLASHYKTVYRNSRPNESRRLRLKSTSIDAKFSLYRARSKWGKHSQLRRKKSQRLRHRKTWRERACLSRTHVCPLSKSSNSRSKLPHLSEKKCLLTLGGSTKLSQRLSTTLTPLLSRFTKSHHRSRALRNRYPSSLTRQRSIHKPIGKWCRLSSNIQFSRPSGTSSLWSSPWSQNKPVQARGITLSNWLPECSAPRHLFKRTHQKTLRFR